MKADDTLFIGLDLGTSGARAVVINENADVVSTDKVGMAEFGSNHRDPSIWWSAAAAALKKALGNIAAANVRAVCVDGTSGTMVPVDGLGKPLRDGLMYNDPCLDTGILERIAKHAPETSAVHGTSSGLARAITLNAEKPAKLLHQADWVSFRLSGKFVSDANNALKTGYDAVAREWPEWIAGTGLDLGLLPNVFEAGTPVGTITASAAEEFALPHEAIVVTGTTDGCASFLATGAERSGDGVTALGTTLTLKILSDAPVFAPQYGIYSHRILGKWLAGGASNSGGAALLAHFSEQQIVQICNQIDPETNSNLAYYPLPRTGERFPIADPTLVDKTTPRPDSEADFLKGLLEGIAEIEALGYQRLEELGAPKLNNLFSVGGGAKNRVWTRIRERRLNTKVSVSKSGEAAYGAALLARSGYQL